MKKNFQLDASTIVAVLIGGASLMGLCLILLLSQVRITGAEAHVTETSTPFKYIFLATEPGLSTELPATEAPTQSDGSDSTTLETAIPESDATPPPLAVAGAGLKGDLTTKGSTLAPTASEAPVVTEVFESDTPSPTMTPLILSTSTFTSTPGSATQATPSSTLRPSQTSVFTRTPSVAVTYNPAVVLPAGLYDDFEPRITYIGTWDTQGVIGTYLSTLHVSNNAGNALAFSFVGQQVVISYQGGGSLGRVIIVIDNEQFELDQTIGDEWVSKIMLNAVHNVTITHIGGGSVNLDSVLVPDFTTQTPTPTPTTNSP